jgi:hypothetical protein|tara:strand:- start:353 stop:859 length:507 start_codon:yes stop_codon:yes gene_type:complete
MALKADRNELDVDISFFMNETAEKGQIVSYSTAGSGAAMDQAGALATVAAATGSVIPIGVLLNDVVDIDLTRQHINWHKDEVQKGGKVAILKKGYVVTDQIEGTPTAGALAFMDDADTGKFAVAASIDDTEYTAVGRFMSVKDEDGYCKVEVNLPIPIQHTVAGALLK